MSVDWRGLSMAMAQLSDIGKPNQMDLLEREYELRAVEKEKENKYNTARMQFDTYRSEWLVNKERINVLNDEIKKMDADALSLLPEFTTEDSFMKIVGDTNVNQRSSLEGLNSDIELKVNSQLDQIAKLTKLNDNMNFGRQIRESQGRAGGDNITYFTEAKDVTGILSYDGITSNGKKLDARSWEDYSEDEKQTMLGYVNEHQLIINPSGTSDDLYTLDQLNNYIENGGNIGFEGTYDVTTSWDFNQDGTVQPHEYEKALELTIEILKKQDGDESVIGIREGYWDGWEGNETVEGENRAVTNDIINTAENIFNYDKTVNPTGPLEEGTINAHKDLQEQEVKDQDFI